MEKQPDKQQRKPQQQKRVGREAKMKPVPVDDNIHYIPSGKLKNKIVLITGGDSGIGKAVAILFAKEGANIAIAYLNEHEDARATRDLVRKYGAECLLIPGDLRKEANCKKAVKETVKKYGKIDILINNLAIHYDTDELAGISEKQMMETFSTNLFSYFRVTKAALAHMSKGSAIINTSSVTAFRGSDTLIDYSSTKGAIVSFTRSLSANLVKKGIRVNGVAPGPVWTPLIASSFKPSKVAVFGSTTPMGRAAQPFEIAPCYLFLACSDSAYITGQFLHPNGGEIING